jgi:hypothetical protein
MLGILSGESKTLPCQFFRTYKKSDHRGFPPFVFLYFIKGTPSMQVAKSQLQHFRNRPHSSGVRLKSEGRSHGMFS